MLEALEPRTHLSGNVIAALVNGSLVVRGDGDSNQVVIRLSDVGAVEGALPSVVVVGADGTTVNGGSDEVLFRELPRDVRVKLGSGDDRLTESGLSPTRDLSVDLGRGADSLMLDRTAVGRNLAVRGAGGAKTLDLRNVTVAGRTSLATGAQADAVSLADSTFTGRATIRTGAGNDAITGTAVFSAGRSINDGPGDDAVTLVEGVTLAFDFRGGDEGWVAGFADYDPGNEVFESGLRPLPAELRAGGTGFLFSGVNLSDDLFMFLKRRLAAADGVVTGVAYRLTYTITFASNAPSNSLGIGGPPGESVYLKAGAASIEPTSILDSMGDVRLNVDKGAQSNSGSAASVVGNIANGIPPGDGDDPPTPYVSLIRTHTHTSTVTASPQGELWLLVGTDSGYEGETALYYQRIEVSLVPVAETAV